MRVHKRSFGPNELSFTMATRRKLEKIKKATKSWMASQKKKACRKEGKSIKVERGIKERKNTRKEEN